MGMFEDKGMVIAGLRFLSPREAYEAVGAGALLVDLRADYLIAMKAFSVFEILCIPHRELAQRYEEIPKGRPLVLADSSGVYTKDACAFLQAQGYDEVACLSGGILDWDERGMPTATDADALLHGDCACVMRPRYRD
jgi:rhodanese-related sulfurtransferase